MERGERLCLLLERGRCRHKYGDKGCDRLCRHGQVEPETSDGRLKTDVKEMAGVLDKLDGVRGVTYRWNEAAGTLGADVGGEAVGVIAQELEGAFPQLVSNSESGYKSVQYGGLTAVLLEAVKELKAENEDLRQRIEALEAERQ